MIQVEHPHTRVGFAGLGIMGSRMARRLVGAGFPTFVWNRTLERAGEIGGAVVATSPAALAVDVDVVCTCLADPAAVDAVFGGPDGLLVGARPGQLFIDFSTIAPDHARRLEERCAAVGASFLDAPVTGSKGGAQHGTLVIMVGGADADVARAGPVFEAVGEKVVRCGPVGAGSQVKLAGNALIAAMLQSFSEGLLATSAAGLDPRVFLEVVKASGYRSPYFEFKGRQILERDFDTHFAIDLMHKDLALFIQTAARDRVPTPTAAAVAESYTLARAAGKGHLDIAAVITAYEEICGRRVE